jgi:hypothetical protein
MESPQERRARIEREIGEDLNKTMESLLTDIHEESVRAVDANSAPTARTLARFASLLSILSRKAEASSTRLEKYTATLVTLTRILAFIAGATILAIGLQIYFMIYPPK